MTGVSTACESILIGPLRINPLSMTRLVDKLIGHCFGDETQHVITANAQFYVMAEEDERFRACVNQADYVCADGASVVMACKWLRSLSVARVAGVDLIPKLCEAAAPLGLPVFFLGGKEGTAERSAALLANRFPGLRIAGVSCPAYGFLKNPQLLEATLNDIKEAQPAILFVALGAPQQEYFIQQHIRPLTIPVAVGVGGSFEMIAGNFRRAPVFIQRAGLEWAFRWVQEPRRLARRYLVGNTLFVFYFAKNLFSSRRSEQGL